MSKYTARFKSTLQAKGYIERVKKLPYVRYASDYMGRGGRSVLLEIDGDLTPEREKELNPKTK